MQVICSRLFKSTALIIAASLALLCRTGATETPAAPIQVLISVPDQRLAVVCDGELVARFPVSTSRFGTGDNYGSYKTPLGQLKVCDKIGDNLTPGAVIRHRSPTGEVLAVNAPGRDPIVTRVIWLDGLEQQNKNARARGIYIHGTPEEYAIGTPVSWGCIRMRSKDVIKVFNQVPVGTVVCILPNKLPHMHRYEPPKVQPIPAPDNSKPPEPNAALASATKPAAATKPTFAPSKPAPAPEKIAASAQSSLPPVAEGPADHGSTAAWKAIKSSYLLANLPGSDSGKLNKKTTQ